MQVFDRSGLLLICCVSLADVWILHYYQTATVVTVVSVAVIVLVNYISKRRTETEFRFTCSGFFIYSEICVFVCTGLHSGVCVWSKRLFHQLVPHQRVHLSIRCRRGVSVVLRGSRDRQVCRVSLALR